MNMVEIENWIAKKLFEGDIGKAKEAVERFLDAGKIGEDSDKRFESTRLELLRICYKEKNPQTRWDKAKNLLLDNLESQTLLPTDSSIKYPYIFNLDAILRIGKSFVSQCMRLITLLNTLDVGLPEGIKIFYSVLGDLNSFQIQYNFMHIRVRLRGGEIKGIDIPVKEFLENYQIYYSIFGSGKYRYRIRHETFFDEFKKRHPEEVKTYRLNPKMKPSEILNYFDQSFQEEFLADIFDELLRDKIRDGIDRKKIKWKLVYESTTEIDIKKIAALLGKTESDFTGIAKEFRPLWRPNDPLLDIKTLTDELADCYLRKLSFSEIQESFWRLLPTFDYDLFSIPTFRYMIGSWKENKIHENLRSLQRVLDDIYTHSNVRAVQTEKKYWGLYLDVERFRMEKECTKQQAFKELAKDYGMKCSTIATRYKEKAKEARRLNLTAQDIIKKYGLFEFEEVSLV